jgi:hypothetical protein
MALNRGRVTMGGVQALCERRVICCWTDPASPFHGRAHGSVLSDAAVLTAGWTRLPSHASSYEKHFFFENLQSAAQAAGVMLTGLLGQSGRQCGP